MTFRQCLPQQTVYHASFPHWGTGLILDRRFCDNLGYPTERKVLVRWSGNHPRGSAWMRPGELRKTPLAGVPK